MPHRLHARKMNNQIVFEKCKCGGLFTQHQHSKRGQHHGPLPERTCEGYSFDSYVSENEAVNIMLEETGGALPRVG